jgi:hypothetical protein
LYDAVRISEVESRSALPNAPVVPAGERSNMGLRFIARLAMASALHRIADMLEPNRELLEPRFSPDPCLGC